MHIAVLAQQLLNIKCKLIFQRLSVIACLYLSGCVLSTPMVTPKVRTLHATHLATTMGWKERSIHTSLFTLKAYTPTKQKKAKVLTIYIEGDGLAWLSEDMPSDNPTPIEPLGLKIALRNQKNNQVAYLARPCQFVFQEEWRGCREIYWTNLRFSPEVIHATNEAVDYLKKYYHASNIILVGYSGGGAVATLVAARRTDVIRLITVAAMLDMNQWVHQKNLTPLDGSLNPADFEKALASIPQTHWVGGKDTIVPKEVAFAYAKHFPAANKPEIIVVPDFDHSCCWASKSFTILSAR